MKNDNFIQKNETAKKICTKTMKKKLCTKGKGIFKQKNGTTRSESQVRDQSNNVPANNAISWSPKRSESSNTQLLCFFQMIQITHYGTKFKIFNKHFPNQFLYTSNRSTSLLGRNSIRSKSITP